MGPDSVKELYPSGLTYSIGNFGHNPYGFTLVGQAILSDPLDGCQPIKTTSELPDSFFLVIERGSCMFVQKASYGQMAGAKMIIIVDN